MCIHYVYIHYCVYTIYTSLIIYPSQTTQTNILLLFCLIPSYHLFYISFNIPFYPSQIYLFPHIFVLSLIFLSYLSLTNHLSTPTPTQMLPTCSPFYPSRLTRQGKSYPDRLSIYSGVYPTLHLTLYLTLYRTPLHLIPLNSTYTLTPSYPYTPIPLSLTPLYPSLIHPYTTPSYTLIPLPHTPLYHYLQAHTP